MERVKLLSSLKDSGALPPALQSGPVSLAILRMVNQAPAARPTAEELCPMATSLWRAAAGGCVQRTHEELLAEVERLQAALADRNAMVQSQDETIRRLRAAVSRSTTGPGRPEELTPPTPE